MRFLLDENLSPKLVELLGSAGTDVVHVRDLGLASASDEVVIAKLQLARPPSGSLVEPCADQ